MLELSEVLAASEPAMLDDLAALVNIDCGTHNKAGVDRAGAWVAERCRAWGWTVERFPQADYGDCWLARLAGRGAGRVLLLGHLDTVYPDGTAAARPLRRAGRQLIGPGVCDMKGGLLVGLYALRGLQQSGFDDFGELCFFFNSEEEVSSPVSVALYEPLARTMDAALVLESARANGDIVSARKGYGEYHVEVSGKAAHAGVEPEKGANAILELAYQLIALQALNGLAPGVTVNVGVIGGGSAVNVVPERAWVQVDVRATDMAGAAALSARLDRWPSTTSVAGTRVSVQGGFQRPPMAKTPGVAWLVAQAQAAAQELGFSVNDTATGGSSDANMIAEMGIPVIDGLGPVGGLDHSPQEYIEPDSLLPRTAMVAGLVRRVVRGRDALQRVRT